MTYVTSNEWEDQAYRVMDGEGDSVDGYTDDGLCDDAGHNLDT
jgi:hypothetical protein